MKNLLLILMSVILFSACKQDAQDNVGRNVQLLPDSMVLHNNNIYTDTTAISEQQAQAPQPVQKSTNTGISKTTVVRKSVARKPTPVVSQKSQQQTVPVTPTVTDKPESTTPPIVNNSGTGNGTIQDGTGTGATGGSNGTIAQPEAKKKGMSKAAKGAVIGGAAGAVGGAIISKKKGLGAVIGGIVGAAGGYIIGKTKDKKDTSKN